MIALVHSDGIIHHCRSWTAMINHHFWLCLSWFIIACNDLYHFCCIFNSVPIMINNGWQSLAKYSSAGLVRFSWFKKAVLLLIQTLLFIHNRVWKDLGPPNTLQFAQTLTLKSTIFTQLTENIFELHKMSMPIQFFHVKIIFSDLCEWYIEFAF